jgi:hypothetical protein
MIKQQIKANRIKGHLPSRKAKRRARKEMDKKVREHVKIQPHVSVLETQFLFDETMPDGARVKGYFVSARKDGKRYSEVIAFYELNGDTIIARLHGDINPDDTTLYRQTLELLGYDGEGRRKGFQ